MAFFYDFPVAPEGHETSRIARSYIMGGYNKAASKETPKLSHH
jgi:hypothetical protein